MLFAHSHVQLRMMLLAVIVIGLAMEVPALSLASSLICDDGIILSSLRLIFFSPYSFVLQVVPALFLVQNSY
jgi:hypothetical protein